MGDSLIHGSYIALQHNHFEAGFDCFTDSGRWAAVGSLLPPNTKPYTILSPSTYVVALYGCVNKPLPRLISFTVRLHYLFVCRVFFYCFFYCGPHCIHLSAYGYNTMITRSMHCEHSFKQFNTPIENPKHAQ